MREILFRGKRKDNGEWVEGHYGEYYSGKENVSCISIPKETISGSLCYDVIPETIGQYTGLTDKNGIKIFEGDIIQDSNYPEYVFRIEYHNGTIIASEIHTFDKVYLDNFICFNIFEAFVIGNVHDKNELLEE